MTDQTNIILVITDTLRAAHVGCYGNADIHTPNIDALAARGVRFTRAYPESLPTIPVRRAMHTGRRAYPFRNWKHLPWGTVRLPGWQPIGDDEDTLAENLAAAGYQTGFVCTTQHCWNPGFNFHRGFWQWHAARGYSNEDKWGSPFSVPPEALKRYGNPDELMANPHTRAPMALANRGVEMVDEQSATAEAFLWAAQFVEDNRSQPFFLQIDSFAPHEPWQAPDKYYRMYADPSYDGLTHLSTCYGPADRYSPAEIANIQAHYSGLVTHVDHWFGVMMQRLDALGLADNTAVLFVSDHGTNFCDNPRNIIGKPGTSMYPGVMQLPMIVRIPDDASVGTARDELVWNLDVVATAYELAGVSSEQGIDGRSVLPLVRKTDGWVPRTHATCRYGDALCYIDDDTWALGNIDGHVQEAFDVRTDPTCQTPLGDSDAQDRWKLAWERLVSDAGGELPDYRTKNATDALGRKGQ